MFATVFTMTKNKILNTMPLLLILAACGKSDDKVVNPTNPDQVVAVPAGEQSEEGAKKVAIDLALRTGIAIGGYHDGETWQWGIDAKDTEALRSYVQLAYAVNSKAIQNVLKRSYVSSLNTSITYHGGDRADVQIPQTDVSSESLSFYLSKQVPLGGPHELLSLTRELDRTTLGIFLKTNIVVGYANYLEACSFSIVQRLSRVLEGVRINPEIKSAFIRQMGDVNYDYRRRFQWGLVKTKHISEVTTPSVILFVNDSTECKLLAFNKPFEDDSQFRAMNVNIRGDSYVPASGVNPLSDDDLKKIFAYH